MAALGPIHPPEVSAFPPLDGSIPADTQDSTPQDSTPGDTAPQDAVQDRSIPLDPVYFASRRLIPYILAQWGEYRPADHHRAIAVALEKVERGELKRLMIFMPPRHGKSTLCSHYFPAWYLGRNPNRQIISATYAQALADDYGRQVRNQLLDPFYREIFPQAVINLDSKAVQRFHVGQRGVYHGVGAFGAITGRGADCLLIDDPIKGREDADSEVMREKLKSWYTSVAYTRLMPNAAIILIQTRWHWDDLAGWLLKEHAHENWTVLDFPAINKQGEPLWPEQFSLDTLRNIKRTIGSRDWGSLYQQKPTPDEGGILKPKWWKEYKEKRPPEYLFRFHSWDTAFSEADHEKSSYSAVTFWGIYLDNKILRCHLIGAWRGRVDYPTLREKAKKVYDIDRPDAVLIEKKASGQSLLQDLRYHGIPVQSYQPDRDKVARAYSVQPLFEDGRITYTKTDAVMEVIDECSQFPSGQFADYVDTVTQAILYVRNGLYLEQLDKNRNDYSDSLNDDEGNTIPYKPISRNQTFTGLYDS